MSRNLLAKMTPGSSEFSVFDFLWEEIISTSISPKKGCHYAPYIFHMIREVIGINILADQNHLVYRPNKGTVDRLLKIGTHARPQRTRGQSTSQAPGSSIDHQRPVPLVLVALPVVQARRRECSTSYLVGSLLASTLGSTILRRFVLIGSIWMSTPQD